MELNDCPVCGATANVQDWGDGTFGAVCMGDDCGLVGPTRDTSAAAADVWNRLRLAACCRVETHPPTPNLPTEAREPMMTPTPATRHGLQG